MIEVKVPHVFPARRVSRYEGMDVSLRKCHSVLRNDKNRTAGSMSIIERSETKVGSYTTVDSAEPYQVT